MKSLILAGVLFVGLAVPMASAQPLYRSQSGPRGGSGGVEVAPVDKLGPTLPPDNMLSPDSGWNSSSSGRAGVAGPLFGSSAPPLFAPPPPPPPAHQPYIILNP